MTGEPTTTRNRALIGTAVAGLAVLAHSGGLALEPAADWGQ